MNSMACVYHMRIVIRFAPCRSTTLASFPLLKTGTGEMTHQLRELATLAEDLCSVPSIHMAHNSL